MWQWCRRPGINRINIYHLWIFTHVLCQCTARMICMTSCAVISARLWVIIWHSHEISDILQHHTNTILIGCHYFNRDNIVVSKHRCISLITVYTPNCLISLELKAILALSPITQGQHCQSTAVKSKSWCCQCQIRYDTRCYFNVRLKADISQLNLPHGTDN